MEFITELLKSMAMNPVVQSIIIGFIFLGIGWIVKLTKTKKDDEYWSMIQGAVINAFNFAEKMIPDDSKNKTAKKIDQALKEFNENIANKFDRNATKKEIEIAKDMFAELAFELKKK